MEAIEQTRKAYPLAQICRLLEVPRSTYYARRKAVKKPNAAREALRREVVEFINP